MLQLLLQCSLICERIWPVWLCQLSSEKIPSLYVSSFWKGEIRPHPLFSSSWESLPHYSNLATRSSLTKLTLNKMTSLWGRFLEEQQHWTVLQNISSFAVVLANSSAGVGLRCFSVMDTGAHGVPLTVLSGITSAWLYYCLWNLHVKIKTSPSLKGYCLNCFSYLWIYHSHTSWGILSLVWPTETEILPW